MYYLAAVLLLAAVVPAMGLLLRSGTACKVSRFPKALRHEGINRSVRAYFSSHSAEDMAFLIGCIAATVPVWVALFPPMADLPQHAAQVSLFYALQDPNFAFADLFSVNLFTPNLFGYAVIAALAPITGIAVACKIAISLAIAATPLASRFLLRQVGADPYLAWLSFPALYGFAYQWGFVNFLMAAPLGLLMLAFIWRREQDVSIRTSLLIALLFNFLLFCHALALALFGTIATLVWICRARSLKSLISHAWPLATVIPPAIIWVISTSSHPAVSVPNLWDLDWFSTIEGYYATIASWTNESAAAWGRVNGLFPRLFGIRSEAFSLAVGLVVVTLPFGIARFRFSLPRFIPLAVCVLVLLLVPSYLFGAFYIYQRFTQYILPFYLLLFVPVEGLSQSFPRKVIRMLPPVIAFLWIGMMTHRALDFDRDAQDFKQAIASIPEEKRVLSLVFLREDNYSIAPTFLHFPAWYSALKRGVVDRSFAVTQVQPVVYRPTAIRTAIATSEWDPQGFFWSDRQSGQFDYFIIRAEIDVPKEWSAYIRCPLHLVTNVGTWWIYRRSNPNCY